MPNEQERPRFPQLGGESFSALGFAKEAAASLAEAAGEAFGDRG